MWNRNEVSFWNWQYGSVRASPPHRHENTLPSSQSPPNGDGRDVSSAVGTRHAFVHALARRRVPSSATISGHARLDWHAEQSTPAHPAGHDPRFSPGPSVALPSPASLVGGATQCAQLAGWGLSAVHSDVLCLHGGSFRSYAVRHSAG